ncbi:MAG: hypothetical protein D6737_01335 [Chloroflexi bacterium]|nr:MAG: hypothetical protein CUN54_07105 [Phototrophicales bacterium]RMF82586.1 MAG: hypothetical protein D6737_01335 [Chloroflexota bacterium]
MRRFFVSLFAGFIVGVGLGLYLGWIQFPVQFVNSPAADLAENFRDDYTVMIAAGYQADGDVIGAIERLRILNEEDIPEYVQDVTVRYITNSRDVDDIRNLVALSEALGKLLPIMEPYRQVTLPGQQP